MCVQKLNIRQQRTAWDNDTVAQEIFRNLSAKNDCWISECVCLCFCSSPSLWRSCCFKITCDTVSFPQAVQRIFDPRRIRFPSQRSDDWLVGEVEGRFSLVFLLHDAERPGCEILTNFHRAEIFTSPAPSERLCAPRLLSLSCALGRVREWHLLKCRVARLTPSLKW